MNAYCNNCGTELLDDSNLDPLLRQPCPECGSTGRSYTMHLERGMYDLTGNDVGFSVNRFVGRKADLHRIDLLVGRKEKLISIIGPPGIGKTSLARKYFEQVDPNSYEKRWIGLRRDSGIGTGDVAEGLFGSLRSAQPLLLFLDGIDEVPDAEARHALAAALKTQNLSSIILTSRFSLLPLTQQFGRMSEFELDPIRASEFLDWVDEKRGVIYDLTAESGVTESKIIQVAAPGIITLNDSIIRGLQRCPLDVFTLDPFKLEEIVADLLHDQGCEVEVTPRSGDGGADILAKMDSPIGRLLTLVDVKRYKEENPVGVGLVRQLNGAIDDWRASHGMLVTTSRFTRGAQEFRERHEYRISLKGYGDLTAWISGYKGGKGY